jgi:site-specific DNA recombinase
MKKAILYIRVSTDEQAERGHSLAYQEEKLKMYCQLKGIEIIKLYKEDYSAKTFERPKIKEMLLFLKANKNLIDEMLFIKWDRFSRNAGDSYQMIKTLNKMGVVPHAIEQPLDLSVPENKTMLALYLTIPEVENDRRALNTISGMRRAKREGRFLGMASKGYLNKRDDRNKPILVVDELNRKFIIKAFTEVAKGLKAVFTILQELRTDGFECGKSGFWRILTNPIYYGGVEIPAFKDEKYEIVTGIHEPIITKALFESVQDVLFDRKKKVPTNNVRREEYPLRGNLQCGTCGKNMTGSKIKNRWGTLYYYYHCTKGCKERFDALELNKIFTDYLVTIKSKKEIISQFKDECLSILKENETDRKNNSGRLETEIKKYEDRIANTQKLLIDGVLKVEEYRLIIAGFETEIQKLKKDNQSFANYDSDLPQYTQFATHFFANIDQLYITADLETKSRFLGWMFPNKLSFNKEGVQTLELNPTLVRLSSIDKGFSDKKKGTFHLKNEKSRLVTSLGFKPKTFSSVVRCSIQLSYEALKKCKDNSFIIIT